jgi:hypothetical protein
MRSIYTVRPEGERWVVTCTGVPTPLGVHDRRTTAVKAARDAAERDMPSRLVVVNRHGTVESDRLLGVDQREADIEALAAMESERTET